MFFYCVNVLLLKRRRHTESVADHIKMRNCHMCHVLYDRCWQCCLYECGCSFFSSSLLENSIHPLLLLNDVFPLHIFIRIERICIRFSIDLSLNWQFFLVIVVIIITFFWINSGIKVYRFVLCFSFQCIAFGITNWVTKPLKIYTYKDVSF